MATPSDSGLMMSDAVSGTVSHRRPMGFPSSSSARPRGPPSENMGTPRNDFGDTDTDADGLADDQLPRSSRIPDTANIPRVEDRIGSIVQEHFERFIEK